MKETNFDLILKELQNNKYDYDTNGQKLDVNLICNLLRLKYNCIEIENIAQLLIERVNNCLDKKESWYCDY